ncbi:MAG: VWA domain-containing protein [Prosthecobacter sp.]|nr:VWA domain-containing protein [Prosthecobacter sp.]
MSLSFANPAAAWCLLGIPVVLAIHFLQRRSRRQTITTLFLLQQMRRESETGNRIERLRLSIPLGLQLLMVLLLAWLLAGPRWLNQDAVQRIAIVLDSSASMQAFREAAAEGTRKAVATLSGNLPKVELTLLSSDPEAATLYHGAAPAEMFAAERQWDSVLGVHDFTPSLRTARSLVGEKGVVLLITDHLPNEVLPYGGRVLSVGQETANVGWVGVTVEEKDGQWIWRALVRNHGHTAQERQWRAGSGDKASAWTNLPLGPGETRSLSGPFIGADERLLLSLSPDSLVMDDQLPVQRPRPKPLTLHGPGGSGRAAEELTDLFKRFDHCEVAPTADRADVRVIVWPPSVALAANQAACVFASPSPAANAPFLTGQIVAEDHPLTQGLNWQSLLVREGMVIPREARDRILLWQGERPLISLRTSAAGTRQLFCHFDLATSNARKLPALAVLLHRFLEGIRQEKVAPEAANFDLRQRLQVAHQRQPEAAALAFTQATGAQTIPLAQSHLMRAPAQPGFFEVKQGGQRLLTGAAHFADTREADLSAAKPFDELAQITAAQVETTHAADANWRLWLLLLLGALAASWWFTRSQPPAQAPAPSLS